jgi:hypothetical protein
VVQRSTLDLASSYIGQSGNIREPVNDAVVDKVWRSEVAHVVYQALSRGCCRVVRDGKAKAMKAWVIHQDDHLKGDIEKAMPGVRWETWKARYLVRKDGKQKGTTAGLVMAIAGFLNGLPQSVTEMSSKKLKEEAGLGDVHPNTFTQALKKAVDLAHWVRSGRSVVRVKSGELNGNHSTPIAIQVL